MNMYLEHANITVNNLERGIEFFNAAFPEFKIRGEGVSQEGRKWVHLGNQNTYLAINETTVTHIQRDYETSGVNHIGFVVEDVEAVAKRLENHGFHRDYPKSVEKFRIRDYFADDDGNQYEFVQYLSEKDEERNQY